MTKIDKTVFNQQTVLWTIVNTKTGRVRRIAETREQARQNLREDERVIRFVPDLNARA